MNATSLLQRVLVFDLPTRLFHWLLALSFFGAYVTGDSERWRDVHALFGYTALMLVVFRIAWGLFGTRYARLSALRPSPRRAFAYLRSLLTRTPEHHAGHNPAGSLAIVGLLVLALATALVGLATLNELGGEWIAELHEGLANATLALVLVHVAGVIVGSLAHRENLPLAMITGRKKGRSDEAITRPRALVGVALVLFVAALWAGVLPRPGLDGAAGLTEVTAAGGRPGQDRDSDDD